MSPPEDSVSLREYMAQWQALHDATHRAIEAEQARLREAWRADAMQWRENHDQAHESHATAHAKEHELNQTAINKAETNVDKAVGAARETMEESIRSLGDRVDHAEAERQRRADETIKALHDLSERVVQVHQTAESCVVAIRAIQDSQGWVVRIVASAVGLALLTAILTLVFRPGLI